MTDEDKKPYFDMREVDIVRHKKQMDELASNGFFTTEDGIKVYIKISVPIEPTTGQVDLRATYAK